MKVQSITANGQIIVGWFCIEFMSPILCHHHIPKLSNHQPPFINDITIFWQAVVGEHMGVKL